MSPSHDRPGPSVTRTISLPRSLNLRLVTQAGLEERSVSGVVRMAVRRYLATAEPDHADQPTPLQGPRFAGGLRP